VLLCPAIMERVLAVVLAASVVTACRTWEDVAVVRLTSVPVAAEAPCATVARELDTRGLAANVRYSGVVASDETLVLVGHVPHYAWRTREVHHVVPIDGFDLEITCAGAPYDTPLPVRVCRDGARVFGVVEAAPLRELEQAGAARRWCHLTGRGWAGEETHAWSATVLIRPAPRGLLAEVP
jgi:hypothetical protein